MSIQFSTRQDLAGGIPCPACRKQTKWQDNPWRPFCSHRCRLLDLGCWADEQYRVPASDIPDLDDLTELFD